ncbi:coiled-coil domain-containing protein 57 isoform X4 [Hemicordylus capensis]|uniref:coiled-coil domain-containing protein 57 isoform X4 n=1 Tax=Hemicordylus capensis TaxID=884348 RepID=UPI002304BF55|nr:coiled-coil domain-containing protein 57 isoform X4 [Hemicordylus capensis]
MEGALVERGWWAGSGAFVGTFVNLSSLMILRGPIMLYTENTFNELLICKEQELKELQAHQMHFQKTALQETQKQLEEMRRKFNKLKEDFTYNLKVLGERDKELEHYDTLFTQLKMVENVKQAEVSDLRIQVDKLQQALAREIKKQEALQYQYQQKLKEHQLELERLHSSKDLDINHHREEYENMKQQLERKLQEVEGELALQRQELLVEFDAEMKKREHEFRRKADEMSNLVLSHELKVKLLTKELEALKEAGMKAAESLKVAEATNLELEKEVKCKAWEIKDLAAVKDAKIHDLEGKLDSVQLSWKKEKETFERKHAAIDRFAREKDAILASVKEAHAEQIHKWEHQFRELQINKETLEMQLHRADWRHTDSLREKEAVIEKLKQELETLKTSWDSQVAQISKETVSKDLQIQAFQEEELKLRAQLASFLQDTESYKQQLLLAREREESLERAKVQIELDCQRRCENAERNQYQKSEALIRSLSTARDQVTAELREKEQKLHELEIVLSAVTLERDQTVQELQKHGLLSKGIKQVTLKDNEGAIQQGFPSAEIQRLQEQNITLRAVIAEMRREMETLNIQAPPSDGTNMKTQDADRMNTVAVSFTPGTLHLDEIVPETALRQHEVRAPQEDSVRTQDVQVNLVTKRPQDNSVQLKQKLFDLGAGDGPYQHTGNRAKVLQSKLKEAVRKICSLSKEKQQLLEMVNRLRAELGAASKGGFKDAKSSNQPQDHTFPGTLCLKEFARETKHRLLALEHLQYQLTTQELQYAQQKHASGKCSHFVESLNNKDVPCNSSCSKEVEVPLKQESFVRNHETVVSCQYQPLRKGSTRQSQEGQLSSSGAHSSLQDIWQILEMGSSPSILSPQSNNDQEKPQVIHDAERFENWGEANADNIERAPAAALTVRGTKFDVQSKLKPNKASCSQLRKPRTSQRMTKIRNYNVKD